MRVQGSSTSGVRRRADGAVDARRTDSHDPRIYKRPALWASLLSWRFSFDRPRPFSFVKTKENGGGFPAGGNACASNKPDASASSCSRYRSSAACCAEIKMLRAVPKSCRSSARSALSPVRVVCHTDLCKNPYASLQITPNIVTIFHESSDPLRSGQVDCVR